MLLHYPLYVLWQPHVDVHPFFVLCHADGGTSFYATLSFDQLTANCLNGKRDQHPWLGTGGPRWRYILSFITFSIPMFSGAPDLSNGKSTKM